MRALVAVLLLVGCSVAWADPGENFTYKGVKIGDGIEVVRDKLPAYECRGEICDYSMRLCIDKQSRNACDAGASFGGAWVNIGTIRLHEGRVISMTLLFTQTMVAAAAEAATQAYGAPTSDEVKDLQTRAGAKLTSWNKVWQSGGQSLQITQRVGDIGTGMASITSDEGRAILERERKARAEKGAKDF